MNGQCFKCYEHVASRMTHVCNVHCRPPFHSGGGVDSATDQCTESMDAEIKHLHNTNCCLTSGCVHEYKAQ